MTSINSWKPEVIADSSGKWVGNGLRFATQGEAERYVEDLFMRWTSVRQTRVVPCQDAPTFYWDIAGNKAQPLPPAQ